jgi:hypothetical protein
VNLDRSEVSPIFCQDLGEIYVRKRRNGIRRRAWTWTGTPWSRKSCLFAWDSSGLDQPCRRSGWCGTVCDLLEEHLGREGLGTFVGKRLQRIAYAKSPTAKDARRKALLKARDPARREKIAAAMRGKKCPAAVAAGMRALTRRGKAAGDHWVFAQKRGQRAAPP